MRKQIVLVLLVPILALTLISCDADMRSNFANFLGGLGGNVYIDGGLVEANKEDVKAAVATITGLGSGKGAKDVAKGEVIDDFGIDVTIPDGVTSVMKPQPKADQNKLKDDLSNALNSTQQTAELKEELKKPVVDEDKKKAVQGTVTVFNATIEALSTELDKDSDKNKELKEAINKLILAPVDAGDTITEGDVLLIQMMTNLVSNTIDTLKDVGSGNIEDAGSADFNDTATKNKLLSIVDDALFTAQIAEELSGAANIDFSGQLDLVNLINELNKGSKASRDGDDDDDFDITMFIGSINNLGPELVQMFGLKKGSDGKYDWELGGYRKFISTQQAYRGALEHALTFAGKGDHLGNKLKNRGLVFDTSTAVKYLIAVAVTETNEWDTASTKTIITASINANTWIASGTATEDTKPEEPNLDDINFEGLGTYLYGKGEAYVKKIFENIKLINDVNGILQLSEPLQEFLDDDDPKGDGFKAWFESLKTTT